MCTSNGNYGFMRTYISCYIGNKDRRSLSKKFFETGVLKNFANFTGKHLRWSFFLIKLRETLSQVFPCEICKIYKNTFFTEHG